MNDEFEEVEAILKPTPMKRKIVCLVITIALTLLTALGILLNNQIDYLQEQGLNHINVIPKITKGIILMRIIAIVCTNAGLKYNKLIFWNLSSTLLFVTFFISSAINVFVIQVCPDLTKRVWSVLIILAEVILTIIAVICSMIETYQTIITSPSKVSLELVDPQKEIIVGLLRAIINVLPGANMFSEKLISADRFLAFHIFVFVFILVHSIVITVKGMSYRGGRVNEDNVDAAVAQAKILRDFVSRLSETCRDMCLTSNKMNSLEVGEQTCIDRCTYKYWNAHHLVSDILAGKSGNEA